MGQQPGQTANNQPITFDQNRANAAMGMYQTRMNSPMNNGSDNGYVRPGFDDFINFYMQSAAGPPATATAPVVAPAQPSAFQQFRQQRAAGVGPVRRTMQYTPPSGPRMARDNRVAGDMAQ